jgi:hypothetical protein
MTGAFRGNIPKSLTWNRKPSKCRGFLVYLKIYGNKTFTLLTNKRCVRDDNRKYQG